MELDLQHSWIAAGRRRQAWHGNENGALGQLQRHRFPKILFYAVLFGEKVLMILTAVDW